MSVLYIKSLGTELNECQKENMLLKKIIKEQEKMIELMGLDIAKSDFNADICLRMKKDESSWCGSTDEECRDCIIEYFKKKAREENETN